MLMNNKIIVVINQMWHQMVRNDEINNLLIEKYFQKCIIYTLFRAVSTNLGQKLSILLKIDHYKNGLMLP